MMVFREGLVGLDDGVGCADERLFKMATIMLRWGVFVFAQYERIEISCSRPQ